MASIFQANTQEGLNAHLGPALIFYAPYGQTFPTDVGDVINMTGSSQWLPKTGWTVAGATKTGIKVERGFTKVDRSSDQSFGPFDSRPNQWTASVTTELLETTPTNMKLAWEGSSISTDASSVNTTLSANVAVGASSITVTSAASISSGDVLIVDGDAEQEWHTVTLVSGTTLFFGSETMLYTHVSGAVVLKPGKSSQNFGHMRQTKARVLAVIAPLVKISTTYKVTLSLIRMWAFRLTRLGEGNKTMNLTQENDWVLPVSFHAYRDPAITDEVIDTFKVFDWTL